MQALRYLAASLACGLIAVFASENLFWSFPRPDVTLMGLVLTWGFYSLATAAALSAVIWTGLGGWRGIFLGGAVLGFVVEGVLVDTMYDAFPFQLAWTPMAWHALLTALLIGGVGRLPGWRGLGLTVAAGVLCGVWAQYWPTEPLPLPSTAAVAVYIVGCGLVLPVAHRVLDLLGQLPRPHGAVLLVAPALWAALWVFKLVEVPLPQKAALPVMLGLTVWAMWRLGRRAAVPVGPPGGWGRALRSMLIPLISFPVAVVGWTMFPAGVAVNWPFALTTVALSVGLWLWLLWQAARVSPAR